MTMDQLGDLAREVLKVLIVNPDTNAAIEVGTASGARKVTVRRSPFIGGRAFVVVEDGTARVSASGLVTA